MKGRVTWAQRIQRGARTRTASSCSPSRSSTSPAGASPQYELLLRMRRRARRADRARARSCTIAERLDLIQEIDRWVIAHGDRAARRAPQHDGAQASRSRSTSRASSIGDPELLALHRARAAARPASIRRGSIFEITETAAIVNIDRARAFGAAPRRARLPIRARRLRRRLRLVLLPQAPAVRLPEDRRRVRPQTAAAATPTSSSSSRSSRSRTGWARDDRGVRRRTRNRRAADTPRRRLRPGLLPRAAAAGGGGVRLRRQQARDRDQAPPRGLPERLGWPGWGRRDSRRLSGVGERQRRAGEGWAAGCRLPRDGSREITPMWQGLSTRTPGKAAI